MTDRQTAHKKAESELLEKAHDLTTKTGVLAWLSAVGNALTHDLPEMPIAKANTSAYIASVSMRAIQS